jgi:predicted RNA-binding protein (virulence factor B family)
VILSPHIAGWTFENHERLAQVIVDKIKAKYFGQVKVEAIEKRVTGIGVSFQIKNPKELCLVWKTLIKYRSIWFTFGGKTKKETAHNGRLCKIQIILNQVKQFMQNFRVDDLEQLLKNYLMKV